MSIINLAMALPLAMTVLGGTVYHMSSKNIPDIHPAIALIAAYILQAALCIGFLVLAPATKSFATSIKELDLWIVGLAVGSIFLELGFILAYKAGWELSAADITSVTIISLVFLGIEVLYLNDVFTITKLIGILMCGAGLFLVG